MSLLFIDSFDHYATADIADKYSIVNGVGSGTTLAPTDGRRSSGCIRSNISASNSTNPIITKSLSPTDPTIIVGAAIKPTAVTADYPLFTVGDGSGWHVGLLGVASGALNARRTGHYTGLVLGATSVPLPLNVFTYVEIKITIHASAGVVRVLFNATEVLNVTGVNTAGSVLAGWTQFGFHTINGDLRLDDLYVCDGAGAAPWNTFLGDVRVDARYPTGAGATVGWTPSTGANWSCVDDATPNDDTDYASAATVGLTDTHVVQDAPVAGATILGVQHCLSMAKTDAGLCQIAPVIRHGTTDYVGTALAPSTTYAYGLQVAQVNPGTSAQWTESGFNAAEFGYKRTA